MSGQTGVPGHGTGSQGVDLPLTRQSVFLTLTVKDDQDSLDAARAALGSVGDIVKNVAIRDLERTVSCTTGIGARIWPRLVGGPMPAELHPFKVVNGDVHTAVSTPGDLFFHIRANRSDYVYELERQLLLEFGDSVRIEDETVGFRYFDTRDLLGFVDGTANPVGVDLPPNTLVGDEDPDFAGGSYLVIQKYTHPLADWTSQTTETQEEIIGRTKSENIELPDATGDAQKSHKTLSTITEDGVEYDILRDNMPFGQPGGEVGTFFISYSRRLWVTERMLERMFIGDPPGKYDRILDFSTAKTGCAFFVPALGLLDSLGDSPAPGAAAADDGGGSTDSTDSTDSTAPASPDVGDTSLGLGSLRRDPTERNE